MCQLLGMSCKEPATINFSLEGFKARGGLTDEHKDGWGIAFFGDTGPRVFRDHLPAHDSLLVQQIKNEHIKSKTVIAHIRKATVGEVALRNCHPFTRELWGQTWIFAHNGHLEHFHPPLQGLFTPEGDTDSERAFCYILEQLGKRYPEASANRPPSTKDIYLTLHLLSCEVATRGVFNIMLSNGDLLFTHCSTHLSYVQRSYPFTQVTLVDCDLTLDLNAHNSHADRMVVVATKPLTRNENWASCQAGETLLFRAGAVIASSVAGDHASITQKVSALITGLFSAESLTSAGSID